MSRISIRYINDFSKALASEVRILLQEVGKLRDERRALQQCVHHFLTHDRVVQRNLPPLFDVGGLTTALVLIRPDLFVGQT